MGGSRWSDDDWKSYSTTTRAAKSTAEIFRSTGIKEYLDPRNILVRESRDSEANPESRAIIVGLDVTGSMGVIAERMAKEGLGALFAGILDRKPVNDPHLMFMAIGDVHRHDRAPLQVSQFEADIRIGEQLLDLYLEGGGGGNGFESYDLPWYFAAKRTSIDCFEKRGKKGYLFTIGDENPPPVDLGVRHLQTVFGTGGETGFTQKQLLSLAQERYDVFHVIVDQGDYASRDLARVTGNWRDLLGTRAINLSNYNHLPEVITSVIEVNEGKDPIDVIQAWPAEVQSTVARALGR